MDQAIIELLAGPLAEVCYLSKGENKLAMWMYCDRTRRLLREPRTWGVLGQLAGRLIEVGFVSDEDAESLFAGWRVPRIPKAVWIGASKERSNASNIDCPSLREVFKGLS